MSVWFERLQARLEYELADFRRRGLEFELDEAVRESARRIVVRGSFEHHGQKIALVVEYPDTFPYFRPEVLAPELRLERHQSLFTGNLCLLDRSTRAWDSDWTAARLITERVPLLLDLVEAGGEALREAEAPQGEPLSYYYPTRPGTAVFVPEAALGLPAEVRQGRAVLAFEQGRPASVNVRALLTQITTKERKKVKRLGSAPEILAQRFGQPRVEISWVRLEKLPESQDPEAFFEAAAKVAEPAGRARWARLPDGDEVALLGVVFPEEVRQGVWEDSWLFAVKGRGHGQNEGRTTEYLARGERLTREFLQERIPGLAALGEATVAVAGVGGIGAPVALELARSQVGALRLLDADRVEAGNIVRWPIGTRAVGELKTEALTAEIHASYPFTDVTRFLATLGHTGRPAGMTPEFELLDQFLDGADLLIDATAEIGAGQLLADLAADRGIPVLIPWATEGLHGGAVALVDPPRTGCWLCLQYHIDSGSIGTPPRDETGTVQPRGCAAPTFTGASFDLMPIVAQAMRTAAAVLAGRPVPGVAVLELNDETGPLTAPRWSTFALTDHHVCPVCARLAA